MKHVVSARRPNDVAREVDALARSGCTWFVLVSVDGGGTVDLERMGAARYAAGLQCRVELEVPAAAAVR